MKGPHHRAKLDVQRVWECPACHTRRRVPGDRVTVSCQCRPEGTWMRLVEDPHASRVNRALDRLTKPVEPRESSS
jgi:hypothetical protein